MPDRRAFTFATLCLVLGVQMGSGSARAQDPADPNHPLRNGAEDPGDAWENQRLADGTLALQSIHFNWPWGELYYDEQYPAKLIIGNRCKTRQPVYLFVNNLPYLTLPRTVTVPGEDKLEVELEIITPPEPPPPIAAGPNLPGWGWVEPPTIMAAAVDAPAFHQPNYVDVKGSVVAWHPWIGDCLPAREVYMVDAHIHFRPPAGDDPGSKEDPDLCEAYWKLGGRPAELKDEDCTDRFRELATHYRERVVSPYERRSPESWAWLPTQERIQTMSIDELLAMKARAEALISGRRVR